MAWICCLLAYNQTACCRAWVSGAVLLVQDVCLGPLAVCWYRDLAGCGRSWSSLKLSAPNRSAIFAVTGCSRGFMRFCRAVLFRPLVKTYYANLSDDPPANMPVWHCACCTRLLKSSGQTCRLVQWQSKAAVLGINSMLVPYCAWTWESFKGRIRARAVNLPNVLDMLKRHSFKALHMRHLKQAFQIFPPMRTLCAVGQRLTKPRQSSLPTRAAASLLFPAEFSTAADAGNMDDTPDSLAAAMSRKSDSPADDFIMPV